MQDFQIRVVETIQVEKVYTVKANDLPEALEKAQVGQSESQTIVKVIGVTHRELKG